MAVVCSTCFAFAVDEDQFVEPGVPVRDLSVACNQLPCMVSRASRDQVVVLKCCISMALNPQWSMAVELCTWFQL